MTRPYHHIDQLGLTNVAATPATDNPHGGLNVSILLHAAALISHLQWTTPTFLSVKYNITQPPLTYPLTTPNWRSASAATRRTSAVPAARVRRWRGIRVLLPRIRFCTGAGRRGGCWRRESLRWTGRIRTCGTVPRSAGGGWKVVGRAAAARTPVLHLPSARVRLSAPPRPPHPAPPAPPPGAAAPSSSNSLNHITSIDISSSSAFCTQRIDPERIVTIDALCSLTDLPSASIETSISVYIGQFGMQV